MENVSSSMAFHLFRRCFHAIVECSAFNVFVVLVAIGKVTVVDGEDGHMFAWAGVIDSCESFFLTEISFSTAKPIALMFDHGFSELGNPS